MSSTIIVFSDITVGNQDTTSQVDIDEAGLPTKKGVPLVVDRDLQSNILTIVKAGCHFGLTVIGEKKQKHIPAVK